MNYSSIIRNYRLPGKLLAVLLYISVSDKAAAQNCPANVPVTISSNPNTYYPGLDNTLTAGTTSITLGAASSGTTPVSTGDLLLLIQMQGAEINSVNTNSYGDGVSGGASNGYLNNTGLLAGNMEYVVATNTVPLTGGTLTLLNSTTHTYKNANFGTHGQYRYQVIKIGLYHSLTLSGTLTAQPWNGTTGGVIVISVTNQLNFNGQTITAAGAGFRGGGGRQLSGGTGGLRTDLVTMSTSNFNGSKGEGLAGTPRFINNNGTLLDNGAANEGYAGGSYAAGAPGNAGGGGTDGNPASNDQNSGGGGGANGGTGGRGGNSWSSNVATGGEPGMLFQEKSPSRLVMGGGGGAGTSNNGTGTPGAGFASSGAAGGGIVLLTAGSITGTGTINVSGANAYTTVVNDANGGGGAGGSVLIYAGSGHSGITVVANGGNGGTNAGGGSPPPHGPGGGGGGGVIYSNATLNPASSSAGGSTGLTTGNIVYGATVGSNGIIASVNISQLPPQYLSCSVLPTRFKSVSAKLQQKDVIIEWHVTNETAARNYTVERSADGKKFISAGVVEYKYSANGDNSYRFTDRSTNTSGTVYYRIKQTASGNSMLYSSVVNIRTQDDGTATTLNICPNPAVGANANIRFTVKDGMANTVNIRIISMSGVAVWQKQYKANEGVNVVPIDNLASIPNGAYFIQYLNGSERVSAKMLVRH